MLAGRVLAAYTHEDYLFRVAVLSIVVALAVGQNAGLLCKVWCHPPEAVANGCYHHESTTSSSVKSDDTCSNVVLGVTAFVREDVRGTASAPHAQQAVAVLPYQFSPSTTETRARGDSAREGSLEKRPLKIALRI